MRVLMIGPFPDPITGNSLSNRGLYKGLKKRGVQVNYINTATEFSEKLGAFSFNKLFSGFKIYCYLYKVFFASVIYLTPGQTFLGVMKYLPFLGISWLFRKKIIVHIHGNYIHQEYKMLNFPWKNIYHFVLSLADTGIVLSPMLRKNLEPFLDEKNICEVSNFVEDYILDSSSIKSYQELRIIYLSNLMVEKGIFELLDALKIIKKRGVKYQVRIAGDITPGLKEKFEEKLQAILDNTEYLGVVSGKEKLQLLEWGNTFVLPTYYSTEGQPISILEAMATGNIVLTTDQGGIIDIFSEKNGRFIEKKNSDSIVEKLIELNLADQKEIKKITDTNIKFAKKFTEEDFVENILAVINSIS